LTIKPNKQNTETCIQSYCINSSQILLNTKDHQVLTIGCPNTHATIPRGQAAAILENVYATVRRILKKFGTVTHIGPLQGTYRYEFEFLKIQDGGRCRLENHKNRDISATV